MPPVDSVTDMARRVTPSTRMRGILLCLLPLVVVSCTTDGPSEHEPQVAPRRTGSLATAEWEAPAWVLGRYKTVGARLDVVAMRSGGGIVAVLQRAPLATYEIMLEGLTTQRRISVVGGTVRQAQYGTNPPLGNPIDVVGVTADGVGWYLDVDSGRILSQDVGGMRRVEVSLGARAAPRSGCLLGDRGVAFLDSAHVDTVFVQDIAPPHDVRRLPLPGGYVDGVDVRWTDVRFGGSRKGPCVLWAPRMRTVLLVSDSAVRPLGPLVEPVQRENWYQRSWRWIARQPAPRYVIDASSFPGGVALLVGGRTPGARRMIDLYDDAGTYEETMVLPMPSMRIAADCQRLYVLRQNGDSVLFASYVLPSAIRARMAATDNEHEVTRIGRLVGARVAHRDIRLDTARVIVPRKQTRDSSP